jgi:hypothetical protein
MSPRVLASLLAVTVAGVMIASCGDQPSPTAASPVAVPAATVAGVAQTPTLIDMLADPAASPLGAFAEGPPVVYPPNSQPDTWPPGPPPRAQPGVPVPTEPTTSP